MSENRSHRQVNGWKWAALVTGALLVLMLTCAISLIWGGMVGFAMGRATAPQRYVQQSPVEGFEIEPFPDLPLHPFESTRPWLGVYYEMQDLGALVTGVLNGSPAEAAQLQVGDIITAVDGRVLDENQSLGDVIQRYSPGDRVTLTILRDGRESTIRLRLAARMEMPMPIEPDSGG